MSGFVIGALLVAGVWMYFSFKSNVNAHRAFDALDESEEWLRSNGLIPSTVKFSSYTDPSLAKHSEANVIIGFGEDESGERKGIVLEVVEGVGVVEGIFINPPALTSHHKTVSMSAKIEGVSLIDAMKEKERKHSQEFGGKS